MKRVKRLFGDLIAAAISLLILASAFTLPFETVKAAPTAAGPAPYSKPSGGAGRVAAAADEENGQLTIDNGQLRNEESEVETEAVGANGQLTIDNGQLTMSPHPSAEPTPSPQGEGLIEVIPEREDPPATELDALIREAAERYGLPWELVSAVVWAESRYDPNAVSGTPDYGLMQVTASVCAAYGLNKDNRLDPAANLDAGCRILREKIDESGGDLTIALMKYNEGDAGYLENIAAGIWSTKYTEDVLGKYYEIIREGKR